MNSLLVMVFLLPCCWIIGDFPSVEAIPYQVTTQGFLKVLNRSEPLVLFRTKTGIQALSGNHTCIDNKRSVYYTVNKQIEYFSYSSEENYMMMITSDNEVCFRNLYKSDWNNAMQRDIRQECRTHDFKNSKYYGLSINHHVVFSITHDMLHFFSMAAPLCGNDLYRGPGGHGLKDVRFLHITNFVRNDDRILLAYEGRLEEYTAGGVYLSTRPLAKASEGETLISIDSDEGVRTNNSYFFMFIQRGNDSLLRRINNSITGQAETIFSAPNTTALSIDVSSGLMAILLRQRLGYRRSQKSVLNGSSDDVMEVIHGDYLIALRGSFPSHDNATLLTYHCNADHALKEVIMVNRRKQRDVNFCEENEEACAVLGRNKICDYQRILATHNQYRMDETSTQKELHKKVFLITIFAGLTLLQLLCFTTAENNGHI